MACGTLLYLCQAPWLSSAGKAWAQVGDNEVNEEGSEACARRRDVPVC